ncbi:YceI family protein [Luteibacter sp. PPL201]|jgi:polyisoprenoid-binding protein YceI|uniref:YceI family protein n=1 Tax=Luteibacter sahnii TaxID=3021977 RepID=A0ABT6BCQ5_9GAMM
MPSARLLLPACLALAPLAVAATPVDYQFDPVHTQVVFNVDHNGFSRAFGRLKVREGTLRFDPDDWSKSSVQATIDLTSLDMGDAAWNKAVSASAFLDTAHGDTARYVSDAVEKRGADEGVVHGHFTLRGVTVPLDIPFRVNRIGRTIYGLHTVAGFSSSLTLDRTAFGMTSNRNSVGTTVTVWLEVEAIRGGEAPSSSKDTHDAPAQ